MDFGPYDILRREEHKELPRLPSLKTVDVSRRTLETRVCVRKTRNKTSQGHIQKVKIIKSCISECYRDQRRNKKALEGYSRALYVFSRLGVT